MLKSRRGLLAAGLAVAVVGALGVTSTLNAGAEQIWGASDQQPAAAEPSGPIGDATPPTVLPWGARPEWVRKGRAGAAAYSLRSSGYDAASNDTSGSTQPRGRYAPKGRWAKTSYLKTEMTDVAPPLPPLALDTADPSASPTADPTTDPTTDPAEATTDPTAASTTDTSDPVAETTTDATDTNDATTDATDATDPADNAAPTSTTSTPSAPEPSGDTTNDEKVSYLYNVGSQAAETDGFYTNVTIGKPTLAKADYHTLGELALQSADGKQIIEVGWNVDRLVNGDDDPHLFVFHWVNRNPACYNGCGFVQYSKNVKPGDTLAYGVTKKFGFQYFNGAWWVAFDSEWIGYFPEQLWNDEGVKFSRSGLVQVFGEVAASSDKPCTGMGTGELPDKSSAAYMASISYLNGPTVGMYVRSTTDVYPISALSTRTFRYGGPGAC